jgi:hypothetical protein
LHHDGETLADDIAGLLFVAVCTAHAITGAPTAALALAAVTAGVHTSAAATRTGTKSRPHHNCLDLPSACEWLRSQTRRREAREVAAANHIRRSLHCRMVTRRCAILTIIWACFASECVESAKWGLQFAFYHGNLYTYMDNQVRIRLCFFHFFASCTTQLPNPKNPNE